MSESSVLRSRFAYTGMINDLRDAIREDKLMIGDRISGEVALSKDYAISVTSVRRGIELLVEEGLLTRRQGSGTYVCGRPAAEETSSALRHTQRRDTVAILPQVQSLTYHPYFTERLAGLRTRLGQLGWATWEPSLTRDDQAQDFGVSPYGNDADNVRKLVGQHPEFAGMIVRDWMVPDDAEWRGCFPIISLEVSQRFPYVAYDWRYELERSFRHLLSKGARSIWTLSVFDPAWLKEAAMIAAHALQIAPPVLHIEQTTNRERTLSRVVRHAYDLTIDSLGKKGKEIDGILVGSDFETQGVIDGLQELGRRVPDNYQLLAMTNRESRLQTPWPLTCLVADGFAHGQGLANLMHACITSPGQASYTITLAGTLEVGI